MSKGIPDTIEIDLTATFGGLVVCERNKKGTYRAVNVRDNIEIGHGIPFQVVVKAQEIAPQKPGSAWALLNAQKYQ